MPEVLLLQAFPHVLPSASDGPSFPLPNHALTHTLAHLLFSDNLQHMVQVTPPNVPFFSTTAPAPNSESIPWFRAFQLGSTQGRTLRVLITWKHKACQEVRLVKGAKCKGVRAWYLEPDGKSNAWLCHVSAV